MGIPLDKIAFECAGMALMNLCGCGSQKLFVFRSAHPEHLADDGILIG